MQVIIVDDDDDCKQMLSNKTNKRSSVMLGKPKKSLLRNHSEHYCILQRSSVRWQLTFCSVNILVIFMCIRHMLEDAGNMYITLSSVYGIIKLIFKFPKTSS